jgi:small conductance mechanosensitive channel
MKILENVFDFLAQKEVYGLVVIIIVSLIVYNIGRLIISKIFISGKNSYEIKKRKTAVSIIESIYKYLVLLVMIIFVLDLYGVNVKSLLTGVGIFTAVIGLALQDTFKDVINGLSVILENYYVVGDYIKINEFTGQVIEFGLKSTKVKNVNGEVLIFPNRNVENVINISQKHANLVINIPTAYEEKTKKVEEVLNELLTEIKKIPNVYNNCSYLGISELGASEVIYTIAVECAQEHQWEIKRKILKLIKDKYDEENIKIPYKQIEVHNGQNI